MVFELDMRIDILTLFPEMFRGVFEESIVKRAQERGIVEIVLHNLRDFCQDKHRRVDDAPYGGGPGMILKPEPVFAGVRYILSITGRKRGARVRKTVLLTPQGRRYSQEIAKEFAEMEHLILICGHYEGVDERIRDRLVDEEISIGDYVLSGGEIPAMVLVDSVVRLLPFALGDRESSLSDSFSNGLLETPQYTRPRVFEGMAVPDILLSGHHQEIKKWREESAIKRTAQRRPDLLHSHKHKE